MLAKKRDLASFACSAASRALVACSSAFLCTVMSSNTPMWPITRPTPFLSGTVCPCAHTRFPSGLAKENSALKPRPSRAASHQPA